ncbi:MAG: [FeFe] hydrogenase H-cluster radical SAM maturase HydE [Burkholderiaceae bacterium]
MTPLPQLLAQATFTDAEIVHLLGLTDPADCAALRAAAFELTSQLIGDKVHYRGLIEFSNLCTVDCRYCGIRKSNHEVERYELDREEILAAAQWAADNGYGSICLQAGERRDPKFVAFVSDCVAEIRARTRSETLPYGVGVTLSLGEQSLATYQRWAQAAGEGGGLRYLLRIESSNPVLFDSLHSAPGKHEKDLPARLQALKDLRSAGFQLGTGVMIGLPGQTLADLCADIRTFQSLDIDMIGMGPYITSAGNDMPADAMMERGALLQLSLNMIAVTRLVMREVNIAAATALQSLVEDGRERGIAHGCNIVMPNLTPRTVRKSYQLYDNKPCIEDEPGDCRGCLEGRIVSAGRRVGWNEWGDSRRWAVRNDLPLAAVGARPKRPAPARSLAGIAVVTAR